MKTRKKLNKKINWKNDVFGFFLCKSFLAYLTYGYMYSMPEYTVTMHIIQTFENVIFSRFSHYLFVYQQFEKHFDQQIKTDWKLFACLNFFKRLIVLENNGHTIFIFMAFILSCCEKVLSVRLKMWRWREFVWGKTAYGMPHT